MHYSRKISLVTPDITCHKLRQTTNGQQFFLFCLQIKDSQHLTIQTGLSGQC